MAQEVRGMHDKVLNECRGETGFGLSGKDYQYQTSIEKNQKIGERNVRNRYEFLKWIEPSSVQVASSAINKFSTCVMIYLAKNMKYVHKLKLKLLLHLGHEETPIITNKPDSQRFFFHFHWISWAWKPWKWEKNIHHLKNVNMPCKCAPYCC